MFVLVLRGSVSQVGRSRRRARYAPPVNVPQIAVRNLRLPQLLRRARSAVSVTSLRSASAAADKVRCDRQICRYLTRNSATHRRVALHPAYCFTFTPTTEWLSFGRSCHAPGDGCWSGKLGGDRIGGSSARSTVCWNRWRLSRPDYRVLAGC